MTAVTLARAPRRVAAILIVLAVFGALPATAFHDDGVANCEGCHVTHAGSGTIDGLLNAESPSDVCLSCHATAQGSVLGVNPLLRPPQLGAGNFVFLLEDELNDTPGGLGAPIPGDAAGHNIVAPGHTMSADSRYPMSPGGSFPSSQLGCTSCHDPHGSAAFRLLYGTGPVQGGFANFAYSAPDAIGVGLRSGAESRSHHTAYRGGMSDWCANCHGRYHEQGISAFQHESNRALSNSYAQRYNEYNGDQDPLGGIETTAYLPDVPFEDRASHPSSTAGPRPASRVMCLSCHRAHATSAPAAGRWDFNVSLLEDDGMESGSYAIPSPYLGLGQGPLCAKCHPGPVGLNLPLPDPGTGLFGEPPRWPTGKEGGP